MSKNRIIIISSVSGGGKTTLINRLLEKEKSIDLAVTATSRLPREGEVNGIHYHFYSPGKFQRMIDNGEFAEYAIVHANYYGVPMESLNGPLRENKSVMLNIDVQGMRTIIEKSGKENVITIFLLPPDRKVWEERLRKRGSNTEEDIGIRLKEGLREMDQSNLYDHVVVNDDLEKAVDEVLAILRRENVLNRSS